MTPKSNLAELFEEITEPGFVVEDISMLELADAYLQCLIRKSRREKLSQIILIVDVKRK